GRRRRKHAAGLRQSHGQSDRRNPIARATQRNADDLYGRRKAVHCVGDDGRTVGGAQFARSCEPKRPGLNKHTTLFHQGAKARARFWMFSEEIMLRRLALIVLILLAMASAAFAQLPADAVMLDNVKIPEAQKSIDLCPVYLEPSDPKSPTWEYKGVSY